LLSNRSKGWFADAEKVDLPSLGNGRRNMGHAEGDPADAVSPYAPQHRTRLTRELAMTGLAWVTVALVIAVIAAVTGLKPKDTRPVAGTQLMWVARVVLIVMALVVADVVLGSRP
jgi:hypothetical protein